MTAAMIKNAFKENYYGKIIMFIGGLLVVPLLVLPFYPEEIKYAPSFIMSALFCLALGMMTGMIPRSQLAKNLPFFKKSADFQNNKNPQHQKGSLYVLLIWCYGFLIGSVPFIISGLLEPIHALFESVSGWTTTGLTVTDVTALPRIFLFYRSFMQFCGGLGFVMAVVAFMTGKQSASLYDAENHLDRLMPNLRQTGRIIFLIYSGFLAWGILFYRIFGMELFDAVCHAMTALSTAGHTTRINSIGDYSSFPIEIITIILMLIGASNFAVLLLLTKGKIRKIFKITEIRFMLGLLVVFIPLFAVSLAVGMNMGVGESLRNALFGVVSAFSTTGFYNMDFFTMPPFALGLLFLLIIIGGGAGSTAGGIKLSRTYYIIRITRENIRKRLSPHNRVITPEYNTVRGKASIDESLIADTFGFVACYVGVFIIGSLLLTLTEGCSLFDAMFEFAAALGTVGISNGIINADTGNATLIVQMVGMTLGRLEIYVVFAAAYSGVLRLRGTA